jgi:hypothetical protein
MDLKTMSEGVGLLGTLKEVRDKFTGKAEIKDLQGQLAEKTQQLEAVNVGPCAFGLSSEELAIIAVSVVAIAAIIAITVVATKYQPGMIQA